VPSNQRVLTGCGGISSPAALENLSLFWFGEFIDGQSGVAAQFIRECAEQSTAFDIVALSALIDRSQRADHFDLVYTRFGNHVFAL